jgi:hypothetical protein
MHGSRAFLCGLHIARRESEPERCATLNTGKTLESFDFSFKSDVNHQLIHYLAVSYFVMYCSP